MGPVANVVHRLRQGEQDHLGVRGVPPLWALAASFQPTLVAFGDGLVPPMAMDGHTGEPGGNGASGLNACLWDWRPLKFQPDWADMSAVDLHEPWLGARATS